MKIAVVGTGYVGLVSGTCFAEIGNDVICVDIDEQKVKNLKKGIIPIYEPGLEELVQRNSKLRRLSFTTDIKEAIETSEIIFSAVGTPPDEDHRADLQYVKQVAKDTGRHMNGYKIFVNKSTVPVGTGDICKKIIKEELKKRNIDHDFDIVSNPEFLREGAAVKDTMNPDRIVVGVESEKAKEMMEKLYQPLIRTGKPIMFTDINSSEIIKYASNSFLGMKISFINQMANFCDRVGGDVRQVAKGIGLDSRIGSRFLQAGIGYGGSCFKKDINALIQKAKDYHFDFSILNEVESFNEQQKERLFHKLSQHMPDLKGKKIAIWGVTFKPKTDDLRDAPSIPLVNKLLENGAEVTAFDPIATDTFIDRHFRQHRSLLSSKTSYDAVKDADAVMLLTEWDEFRSIDFARIKELMRGNLVLDGRNIYDPDVVRAAGLEYIGIGIS